MIVAVRESHRLNQVFFERRRAEARVAQRNSVEFRYGQAVGNSHPRLWSRSLRSKTANRIEFGWLLGMVHLCLNEDIALAVMSKLL